MEGGEGPLTITADTLTFDPDRNLYVAEGNVEVIQGRRVLSADRAVLNKDTKDVTAEGRVILMEDGDVMSCEAIDINMESSMGVIRQGRMFIQKGNFYLTADEIVRTGEKDYTIKRGVFTTCDGSSKPWSFSSTTANITIDEYLTSWNTAFRIRGVPVLYMPYLVMPIKRDRQSGFLIPRVGYSDQRGFELDNAFYWAISKNTDATISLNYMGKKGFEEGVEYRYVLSKDTKGTFSGTYLREQDTSNGMWTMKYSHEQFFTPTFYNKTNINYITDSQYYRTYGETVEERSQDKVESYVSFTKNWSRFSLITQFKYFKDLMGQQETTLQRLPEVLLTGLRQPMGDSPFYFSLSSSAVNFHREKGENGKRIDLNPRLSMTLSPMGYFTFTPEVGLRDTTYQIDGKDAWDSREMYNLKGTLSTAFVRVYGLEGDILRKVRHTIEPEVVYEYTPELNQDGLPQFDPIDRIPKNNRVTYSLNNRVAGKVYMSNEDYQVREFVFLKISQGYDINEAQRVPVSETDKKRPFTDVAAQLRITPNQYVSMVSDAAYGTYDGYLRGINSSAGVIDNRGDSLSLDYRFAKDSIEYIRGKVSVKASGAANLSYDSRYSLMERKYLENIYAIDYHLQCWGIQLTYSERPEEKRYFAFINLLGMGTVGKVKGTVQY